MKATIFWQQRSHIHINYDSMKIDIIIQACKISRCTRRLNYAAVFQWSIVFWTLWSTLYYSLSWANVVIRFDFRSSLFQLSIEDLFDDPVQSVRIHFDVHRDHILLTVDKVPSNATWQRTTVCQTWNSKMTFQWDWKMQSSSCYAMPIVSICKKMSTSICSLYLNNGLASARTGTIICINILRSAPNIITDCKIRT